MIGKSVTLLLCLALCACDVASASAPSAANPAHCIAALHYGRTIALRARPADIDLAVQSTARSLYEAGKLQADGRLAGGRTEGMALLQRYAGDRTVMMGLLHTCLDREDADPDYVALNESGALMAAARRSDPSCATDAACCAKMR